MTALSLLVAAACAGIAGGAGAAQSEVRLACTADTNVSSYATELDLNYGSSPRIRVKGHEMLMLAKFDLAPIQGWTVRRASLWLHAAGDHRLRTIGVSTVATDWAEGTGTGTKEAGGATFMRADAGRPWGGRQSDLTDAALTARGTLVSDHDLVAHENGWLEVPVDPVIVHAMLNGNSYGVCIVDEKGQTHWNNDVHSREQSGFAPYLAVVGDRTGRTPATTAPRPPPGPLPPFVSLTAGSPRIPERPETRMRGSAFGVWAYGDCEKANPVSGALLEHVSGRQRLRAGETRTVWDGKGVFLQAARNEFAAFHLCVESADGKPFAGTATSSDLVREEGGRIPASSIDVLTDWYVKDGDWWPEALRPMGGKFAVPDPQNKVPRQRNQSLFVDVYVPHEAAPGDYVGAVTVAVTGRGTVRAPVRLRVRQFTLPDTLTFDVDLNAYGPPGDAAMERAFHRMAHAHRTTLNILAYSHSGTTNSDYVPVVQGDGAGLKITDWSAFDRRFGPYFDGSAFADLPRKGVPLTHAYVQLSEHWPTDIRKHYRYAQTTTAYPDCIVEHAMKAPPVEEAFDQAYRDAFQAGVRQFADHFAQKGWGRTEFQLYFNDKYYYRDPKEGGRGVSWWLLDEPMHRDDWLALRFFGRLFRQALKGRDTGVRFLFRADISRPQWQRDWLDGLVDLMCVSSEFFNKNERCMQMHREQGVRFWHYATGSNIRDSNLTEVAWALKVYLAGGDGLLPWLALGDDSSYDRPTPTTLLYPGERFGIKGPIASLRLKALRRGQQDVEYLAALAKRCNWERERLAQLVGGHVNLGLRTDMAGEGDAGKVTFDGMMTVDLERMRAEAAAYLK